MAVKTLVIEFPWNESADDDWIYHTEEIMHWLRVKFGAPGTAADRKWFSRLHQKIDYFHKDIRGGTFSLPYLRTHRRVYLRDPENATFLLLVYPNLTVIEK